MSLWRIFLKFSKSFLFERKAIDGKEYTQKCDSIQIIPPEEIGIDCKKIWALVAICTFKKEDIQAFEFFRYGYTTVLSRNNINISIKEGLSFEMRKLIKLENIWFFDDSSHLRSFGDEINKVVWWAKIE